MQLLRSHRLYIQLSPQTITVHGPRLGVTLREAADIAIAQRGKYRVVAAVGSAASLLRGNANVQVFSPFAHPRILVQPVDAAEALLQQLIHQALGRAWLRRKPHLVLHPMVVPEGGLAELEIRCLRDIGKAAGAQHVYIWTGRALNDAEVLAAPQPQPHGQWH